MEAGALKKIGGKIEAKDQKQIVGPDPGGDPGMGHSRLSGNGKSIYLVDRSGIRHEVDIPISKPVESGKYFAARVLNFDSLEVCSCCGCIWVQIDGWDGWYDPITRGPCPHH